MRNQGLQNCLVAKASGLIRDRWVNVRWAKHLHRLSADLDVAGLVGHPWIMMDLATAGLGGHGGAAAPKQVNDIIAHDLRILALDGAGLVGVLGSVVNGCRRFGLRGSPILTIQVAIARHAAPMHQPRSLQEATALHR